MPKQQQTAEAAAPEKKKKSPCITEKALALCVLSVLKNQSSREHPLNAAQIKTEINRIYRMEPDRRTVYAAVDTLRLFNYDVVLIRQKGYYLDTHGLDDGIVKLLRDAVNYFPFLTADQTKIITDSIAHTFSEHEQKELQSVTIPHSRKAADNETLKSIAALTRAIQSKKQVSFDYRKYDFDEKKRQVVPKSRIGGRITAHPYALDFFNNHYYLICYNPDHPERISNLRVDRMVDVTVLPDDAERKYKKEELEACVQQSVYGFSGDKQLVTLEVDRDGLQCVIDDFGTKFNVYPNGDKLRVVLAASTQGLRYWALRYVKHVEVIYPESLREEIIGILQNNPYMK